MLENLTRNLTAGLITQFLPHKAVPGRKGFENWALMSRFQASPYTDDPKMQEELKQLQRESADESLRRHRAAVKLMDENAGKSLAEIAQKAPQDEKLIRHIIDLYIAKQNGITPQERQVLALPARQRASYVARRLKGLNPAQQQQVILDLARKRILTETVMSQLPEATNEP